MPCDYRQYPPDWFTVIRPEVLARAGNACEGTPQYPHCRAWNGLPHPETGSRVVLTIAHMNHDKSNNGVPGNRPSLRALCQRCHLAWDRKHHLEVQAANRAARKDALGLFKESEA